MSKEDKTLDKKLLDVLQCPVCKRDIEKIDDTKLRCVECGKEYEVKDGVPHMMVNLDKKEGE